MKRRVSSKLKPHLGEDVPPETAYVLLPNARPKDNTVVVELGNTLAEVMAVAVAVAVAVSGSGSGSGSGRNCCCGNVTEIVWCGTNHISILQRSYVAVVITISIFQFSIPPHTTTQNHTDS
jgi:hypothetical protein